MARHKSEKHPVNEAIRRQEIEKIMDAKHPPMTEKQARRIMAKAKGEIPIGPTENHDKLTRYVRGWMIAAGCQAIPEELATDEDFLRGYSSGREARRREIALAEKFYAALLAIIVARGGGQSIAGCPKCLKMNTIPDDVVQYKCGHCETLLTRE